MWRITDEGALESKDRRVLRICSTPPCCFEKDANGVERLAEGCKTRLDSAMSQFSRFQKNPFVVEG